VGGNYTVLHHTQLLNRLIRDKKLVPVKPVGGGEEVTYHDPCYLGRHNKVYEAPRELIEASRAKLTEMPRHADRGLCCGAGGARMWMEEHIGKRVNHERVEEALDTGASTIATGCPFCRVMITDGVDDVAAATDVPKAEVLDVAQLLLGSLDTSSLKLPEKGTAAKEAEERAAKAAPKAQAATAVAEPEAEPEPTAAPAPAAEKPAAAAPVKGLGIAGGAKRPGAKKAAPAAAQAPAPTEPAKPEAKPEAEVKGLGIAAGARRPGAKKTAAAPAEPASTAAEPASTATGPASTAAEPEVKGLGIAAGARRPGAKKAPTAPKPAAPQPEPASGSESGTAPEPSAEGNGETPAAPVKGLGIAKGARPPGKR
jgi:hypothetical protein